MIYGFPLTRRLKWVWGKKEIIAVCLPFILASHGIGDKSFPQSSSPSLEEMNVGPNHLNLRADQADFSSIDAMVKSLYGSLTFREGNKPDMDRLRALFSPDAQFIRITKEGVNTMTTESFISSFIERIQKGERKSFHESEIFRKTNVFGGIAQVFSTYQKGINTEDEKLFVRGINSIQLYHDGQRWWTGGIVWEDERRDNPIPGEYLGKR